MTLRLLLLAGIAWAAHATTIDFWIPGTSEPVAPNRYADQGVTITTTDPNGMCIGDVFYGSRLMTCGSDPSSIYFNFDRPSNEFSIYLLFAILDSSHGDWYVKTFDADHNILDMTSGIAVSEHGGAGDHFELVPIFPHPKYDIWSAQIDLPGYPYMISFVDNLHFNLEPTEAGAGAVNNPEPSTWLYLASGVGLMVFARRRRSTFHRRGRDNQRCDSRGPSTLRG